MDEKLQHDNSSLELTLVKVCSSICTLFLIGAAEISFTAIDASLLVIGLLYKLNVLVECKAKRLRIRSHDSDSTRLYPHKEKIGFTRVGVEMILFTLFKESAIAVYTTA